MLDIAKATVTTLCETIQGAIKAGTMSEDLSNLINATANFMAATLTDDTMSIEEVADILDIHKRRAYELAHTKNFPAIWIGKSVRVNRWAFYQWMRQRQEVTLEDLEAKAA